MSKVKIYQIKDVANTIYAFRDYHKEDFNLAKDYEMVVEFEMELPAETDAALEKIFEMGNDGRLKEEHEMRSVSVSDVIYIDMACYYVNGMGFERIW